MPGRRRQQGVVLIAVLVVLMLTLLGGIGVMQAVQTGNAMAGNFSFRQAAMQASDRAVSDAMTQLANRVAGGAGNTAVANLYLPTTGAVDATGVPTSVNWASVPCVDEKGALVGNCATDSGNYRVQYVIERRCSAAPDFSNIASIRAVCEYEPRDAAVSAATIALRYRVVIRVRGPRGTESLFEAVVSGPAST
jgi:Tfp pilus assembly protein PilX